MKINWNKPELHLIISLLLLIGALIFLILGLGFKNIYLFLMAPGLVFIQIFRMRDYLE